MRHLGPLVASVFRLCSVPVDSLLQGDVPALLSNHWRVCQNAPWAPHCPAYLSHQPLDSYLIPVRVHGGDASVKSLHGRKMVIMSMHSEFGANDCLTSRLLTSVIYNDWVIQGVTLPQISRVLKWSFDALLEGTYPCRDWNEHPWPLGSRRYLLANTPIAGSFRCVFGGSLGDWAWHSKFLYPEIHGSSHSFLCHRDCASRTIGRLRFQNRKRDAGWRDTTISTANFLDCLPLVGNMFYLLPGFHLTLIRCDFMHAFFLGLAQSVCGSTIWELQELGHFCPASIVQKTRLQYAFASLAAYAVVAGLKLDLRNFTKGMQPISNHLPRLGRIYRRPGPATSWSGLKGPDNYIHRPGPEENQSRSDCSPAWAGYYIWSVRAGNSRCSGPNGPNNYSQPRAHVWLYTGGRGGPMNPVVGHEAIGPPAGTGEVTCC